MPKKSLLLIGTAAVGLAGCGQHAASLPVREQSSTLAGKAGSRLPDFSVTGLGGRRLSTTEFRGKVVLIDFWATWCVPCEREMPGYQTLLDRYGPRGLVVIGLKLDIMPDTEDPARFAKRLAIRYPLAVATEGLRRKFGGIEGLPTTMLYDRAGILRKKVIGFEYTSVFEADVKSLL